MKTLSPYLLIILLILSTSCNYDLTKMSSLKLLNLYQGGLEDAAYPTNNKVDDQLFQINSENKALSWKIVDGEEYVLMLSWKGDDTFYRAPYVKENGIYNTGTSRPLWVTAAPQLGLWMKSEPRFMRWLKQGESEKIEGRLKQLLGLPPNPNYKYNYFIELWVKPKDLFRPCPDPEIDDSSCLTFFPVNIDSTYKAWLNHTRTSRFYEPTEIKDKYPWTALGYTYDWSQANKTNKGLSEYVIKNNSNVLVNKIYTTGEYLKKFK